LIYSLICYESHNYDLQNGENPADDLKKEFLLSMSEDFLELLINLISERYEPYMSQIEAIKRMEREVIHQLSVSSMAHSDLVKNIYPDNEKYTNDLESVLSRVAVFK
jgi:E3 ubiquitin-protein ligase UBR2